ncbi:MAG: hypothetical protein ACQESF_01870 [Nanobdellota archaeon]
MANQSGFLKKAIATGLVASAFMSGIYFTSFKNNKDITNTLQNQNKKIERNLDNLKELESERNKQLSRIKELIRKNNQKKNTTYNVKAGDSLSKIAMDLTNNNSLDWAKNKINGIKLSQRGAFTFETYKRLAEDTGKKNLFTKENLERYGPEKNYPTKGPNFLSRNYGTINLKNILNQGKNTYHNNLENMKSNYERLNQSLSNIIDNFQKQNTNLEYKIEELTNKEKDNFGKGLLFLIPCLGYITNLARKTYQKFKGSTTNTDQTTSHERTQNRRRPNSRETPYIITMPPSQNENYAQTPTTNDSGNTQPEQNNNNSPERTNNYTNMDEIIKNPYKKMPDEDKANRILEIYKTYNQLWHNKYSSDNPDKNIRIYQRLQQSYHIPKTTLYNYINWVDSQLCTDSDNQMTTYVKNETKKIAESISKART